MVVLPWTGLKLKILCYRDRKSVMLTARVYDAGIDEPKSLTFIYPWSINAHNFVSVGLT